MISMSKHLIIVLLFLPALALFLVHVSYAQQDQISSPLSSDNLNLTTDFYIKSCPQVYSIVRSGVEQAIQVRRRNAASLLRLFFHDCFVDGCDASLLLDDTHFFVGEKSSSANDRSARGFEIVDAIKAEVEAACPLTVSCADILAIIARDAVQLMGGPYWEVWLGRKDSLFASRQAADKFIPSPTSDLPQLVEAFRAVGLDAEDLVALVGAHTLGFSRCTSFTQRIYNQSGTLRPEGNINPDFLGQLRDRCPLYGNSDTLQPLDWGTPFKFDNSYYKNLVSDSALLHSDGSLYTQGAGALSGIRELVETFSHDSEAFFDRFSKSIVKMGNLRPPPGTRGEVRKNCRRINVP